MQTFIGELVPDACVRLGPPQLDLTFSSILAHLCLRWPLSCDECDYYLSGLDISRDDTFYISSVAS